jgi:transposase-like protein
VSEALPLLYLHGLSTSDFAPALDQFLGTGHGLSAATITRLTEQWKHDATKFGQRSLKDVDYVYLWVDEAYGAKWPKAVAKITDDLDVLQAFYDYPAEHSIHLRTTNPIESTFATVRLRQRVTKGPGSRAAGVAMAFKLIESAQARWGAVNAPHLVALEPAQDPRTANSSNDPTSQEVKLKSRDTVIHTC